MTICRMDVDVPFEILAHRRRRFIIVCLDEHGTPMPVSDLADEIATWERGAPLPEISADDVQSIYLSLYHNHIPKMADAGVVEYSQEQDAVHLYEEYRPLATLVEIERPRS